MPCYDDRDVRVDTESLARLQRCEAMLCALAAVLASSSNLEQTLNSVNWHEAGISRKQFDAWWIRHQELDIQRKKQAAREKKEEELANKAKSKLTSAELKALKRSL